MPDEVDPADNIDRLLAHLKDDSLAARLVRARQASAGDIPAEGMKAVLAEHLEQVRAKMCQAMASCAPNRYSITMWIIAGRKLHASYLPPSGAGNRILKAILGGLSQQ